MPEKDEQGARRSADNPDARDPASFSAPDHSTREPPMSSEEGREERKERNVREEFEGRKEFREDYLREDFQEAKQPNDLSHRLFQEMEIADHLVRTGLAAAELRRVADLAGEDAAADRAYQMAVDYFCRAESKFYHATAIVYQSPQEDTTLDDRSPHTPPSSPPGTGD